MEQTNTGTMGGVGAVHRTYSMTLPQALYADANGKSALIQNLLDEHAKKHKPTALNLDEQIDALKKEAAENEAWKKYLKLPREKQKEILDAARTQINKPSATLLLGREKAPELWEAVKKMMEAV